MIIAGRLKRRVIIEQAVDVQDSTTGAIESQWTPIATVWADIQPLKGRERMTNGGILAEMDTKITMRAFPGMGLGAKHRIRHTTQNVDTIYNIVSQAETRLDHVEVELTCKSGQNEG